jgi:hypothetical protein
MVEFQGILGPRETLVQPVTQGQLETRAKLGTQVLLEHLQVQLEILEIQVKLVIRV